jgi:hypothetical protein
MLFCSWFELGMIVVVILNVFIIVYQFVSKRDCQVVIEASELAFLAVFYGEVILKWLARGPYNYFLFGRNILDVLIVLITTADIIVAITSDAGNYLSKFRKYLKIFLA